MGASVEHSALGVNHRKELRKKKCVSAVTRDAPIFHLTGPDWRLAEQRHTS